MAAGHRASPRVEGWSGARPGPTIRGPRPSGRSRQPRHGPGRSPRPLLRQPLDPGLQDLFCWFWFYGSGLPPLDCQALRLWTRVGVADVPRGCGRSPGARRQPSDASTTLGRVRNEASPTRRRAPTRASRNQINKPPQNLRLDTQHHRQPRPRDGWPHRVPIRGLMPCGGVGRNPVTERRVRRHGQGQRPASTAAQPAKAQARVIDGAPCATSASPRPGASPGT